MTIPIARIAARGDDLIEHIDEILEAWLAWLGAGPRDVGAQTRAVLRSLSSPNQLVAYANAKAYFLQAGKAAGNGALMRTAPIALAYLNDPERMAQAAKLIAQLTHFEDDAWEACVLWCEAIRRATLSGNFLPHAGLGLLPEDSRAKWDDRISKAMTSTPRDFPHNGWVVHAFQAAIAAINSTQTAPDAIEAAVRAGGDTDTVAALTGALAGALQGVQSLPMAWKVQVQGWPNIRYRELVTFAVLTVNKGRAHLNGWPNDKRVAPTGNSLFMQHPQDSGLFLGNLAALDDIKNIEKVDVAIALCRIGSAQVETDIDIHEVWLVDNKSENLNEERLIGDLVSHIAKLRSRNQKVLLFCHAGLSRTPMIADAYSKNQLERTDK
jgi:ADP-ribosyl-[dinitrogen reductase] hydrolase